MGSRGDNRPPPWAGERLPYLWKGSIPAASQRWFGVGHRALNPPVTATITGGSLLLGGRARIPLPGTCGRVRMLSGAFRTRSRTRSLGSPCPALSRPPTSLTDPGVGFLENALLQSAGISSWDLQAAVAGSSPRTRSAPCYPKCYFP